MEISKFLSLSISLITLVGLIIKFLSDYIKTSVIQEEIGKKNMEQDGKLTKLFDWKDHHEEDANEQRRKFEVQMAEIRGELKGLKDSHGNQFNAIMERLTRVENKIDRLEQRVQS